ncbi:MAG: MarR family transcriptional regulator/GNAT family N-acetyltransferase [Anaerolineae bacterium]|nr:MarR family transcriptional regulator/GNAT family N-acetyltransferase [Phycisphaerae bacterium]
MQAQSGDHVRALGRVALGSRLKRLSERLLSDVARVYESQGIDFKPPWFPLFSLVAEAGARGVTVVEAAKQLQLTHPAVSQFAKEMTKAGLLSARADRKDGRRHSLHPTKKFRDVHARAQVVWRALDLAINELFTEAGVNLIADLARIEEALNRQSSQQRILAKLEHTPAVTCVRYDFKYKSHFKRLNLQWIKEIFRLEPADRAVLDDPQGKIIDQGGEILFAMDEEKVLGVCALKKLDGSRYELCKMAVEKKSRGAGIGRALMEAAIRRAHELRATELVLETSTRLGPAIKLYEKFGFKHVSVPAHTDYARTDTVMRLLLN